MPLKAQIVSRYVPIENQAGHFSYLLELLRYLHGAGFRMELDVLDPWFQSQNIPQAVQNIANVVIMPPLAELTDSAKHRQIYITDLFQPMYRRLPDFLLHNIRRAIYYLQGKPLPGVHPHDSPATTEEISFISERIVQFQSDVLIANHTCLGNIFNTAIVKDKSILTAILTHQIESQKTQDFKHANLQSRDSEWDRENESNLLQYADILLAIQKEEAEVLQSMAPRSEILCAPMSAIYHPHRANEQIPGRCLFVGSDIEHNVYGLRWFLEQVWPQINSTMPQATLHVCGTVCSKIKNTFPNVKLLGRVEQLDPEYGAAEVCLIPLIAGSGLKIKLVEALSHGRACVATSVGVQGVKELKDKALIVADTSENFARTVLTVLNNPQQRRTMENEARIYIQKHLSPEKAYQPLLNCVYKHINQLQNRTAL